jgi:hypothetical protein
MGSTIEDLDPASGVPDSLYEALHRDAKTPHEVRAGRVLRVHRDWLNGGFQQTFDNLNGTEEAAETYAKAYSEIGLPTVAKLVSEASVSWTLGQLSDVDWEQFDERYELLTYGPARVASDAIEAAVVAYIQRHGREFSSAFARAQH